MTPHMPGEDAGWNHCLTNKQDTGFSTCFKTCSASGRFLSRTCFSKKCFLPFPAALLWGLELSFAFLVMYTQMDWQIQQAEVGSWAPLQRHLARGWRVSLCSCTTLVISCVTSLSSLMCACQSSGTWVRVKALGFLPSSATSVLMAISKLVNLRYALVSHSSVGSVIVPCLTGLEKIIFITFVKYSLSREMSTIKI